MEIFAELHEIFWSVFPLDPVLGQGVSALFWSPPSYNDSALIILIVGGSETKLDRCISDGASMLEPHISRGPTSYIIACHIITCKRQKTGYQTSRLLVLKKKISSGDPDYVR